MIFYVIHLSLIQISRSLGLYFEKRGRRQLPQAGEVRRPPRAGVWCSLGPAGAGSARLSNTFYSVLGQGLGADPEPPGASGGCIFKEFATFEGVRGGGGVWRDFVVFSPASRSLLRLAGRDSSLQRGRVRF